MRTRSFSGGLVVALALAGAAHAQSLSFDTPSTGLTAGSVLVRLRAIGVIPQNWNSSTTISGTISTTNQAAPELDFSYFFTDNIAAELIAASTRHEVTAENTAVGRVDAGSVWVLPPTLLAQWHFLPHGVVDPYVGFGVNATWFYASQPSRPTVTKFTVGNSAGVALQVGVDIPLGGNWYANADVKQLFLPIVAQLDTVLGHVKVKDGLSPTVIGAGIGYRF